MLIRFSVFWAVFLLTALFLYLGWQGNDVWYYWGGVTGALFLLGLYDILQKDHSVLRNYPIIGHIRWLMEDIRPELRQYLFSGDKDEHPFNRDQRSLVYQRAKDVEDNIPFGSRERFYKQGYAWVNHSIAPTEISDSVCCVDIGETSCAKPYRASLLNISAMSFGALSANAITALNKGAKMGGFAHDTGEGGISRYHRQGGDLIWELGTGYFGACDSKGKFSPDIFRDQAADDQVKMIEVKLSQGAKPGHGGILPGAKVTPEIAEARHVEVGKDVVSPSHHTAFSTPLEFAKFIADLRELSGGKPVGFKLCIGHKWEFAALAKAFLETEIYPDFIVVDGAEGGTGAAPVEYADHVGTPLSEGLAFARNILIGAGLRNKVKLGASGKVVSAFDIVNLLALGADYCMAGRAFMFSLGCIQSLSCHTNRCPVGVATQDKKRQRALVVEDKAERVYNFHRNTINELRHLLASAGMERPSDLKNIHFYIRDGDGHAHDRRATGPWLQKDELLGGSGHADYARIWGMATAKSFKPLQAD